jgi:hypothetical protein
MQQPISSSQPHRSFDALTQTALFVTSALALVIATAAWPDTPDGLIHLQRVRALSEALAAGVFLPRWFPEFSFGYGYPVLNFYAPAFYYPPAVLHLLGVDVLSATRVALALLYAASALAIFRLARLWLSLPAALLAVAIYLLFPYRLYDLFIRGALPEFAAFLWLPLLIYASVRLIQAAERPAERSQQIGALLLAAFCWAGLILTHNLTALMAAVAAAGVALVLLGWALVTRRARWFLARLLPIAAACVLGILLSAWYSAPAILEARWVGIGAEITQGYIAHFASWAQLFTWSFPFIYPSAADMTVPLPGYVLLIALAGALLLFWRGMAAKRLLLLAALALLIGCLWLTTSSSAWLWQLAEPLLGRLQFPWRWQTLVALSLALLVGLPLDTLSPRTRGRWRLLFACALIALIGLHSLVGLKPQPAPFSATEISPEQMWAFDAQFGQVGATWTGEFLPTWVSEQRWAIGREPSQPQGAAPQAVEMQARLVKSGYLDVRYSVTQTQASPLIFHRFFYPAWQVTMDGAPVQAAPVGDLALLAVAGAPGEHLWSVGWSVTPALWLGRGLAAAGWGIVLWLLWLRGGKRARWLGVWLALWLVVGALALLTASGVTARHLPVQDVVADFGSVQLVGLAAPPAHAGEQARLQLHWLVSAPGGDLTTFVHLLAADGQIVAQQDGPLATIFTPASRWLPGEFLVGETRIALPADLPPGRYDLRIGLYPPGAPDQPLTPAGSDLPFVQAGSLEVRP